MKKITRGTTPSGSINVPLENPTEIWFTYAQNGKELFTIPKSRMTYDSVNNKWTFVLTEEETLKFNSEYLVQIQCRAKSNVGKIASNILTMDVGAILKDGVI